MIDGRTCGGTKELRMLDQFKCEWVGSPCPGCPDCKVPEVLEGPVLARQCKPTEPSVDVEKLITRIWEIGDYADRCDEVVDEVRQLAKERDEAVEVHNKRINELLADTNKVIKRAEKALARQHEAEGELKIANKLIDKIETIVECAKRMEATDGN